MHFRPCCFPRRVARLCLSAAAAIGLLSFALNPALADDQNDCMRNNAKLNAQQIGAACQRIISRGPGSMPNMIVFGIAVSTAGYAYIIQNRWEDAIKAYDHFVRLDAENPKQRLMAVAGGYLPPYLWRAYAHYQLGHFEKAKEDLDSFDRVTCTPTGGCKPAIPGLPGHTNVAGELRGDIEMKAGAYTTAKQYYAAMLAQKKVEEKDAIKSVQFGESDYARSNPDLYGKKDLANRRAILNDVERSIVSLNQKIDSAERMLKQPAGAPAPTPKPFEGACKMFPNLC
jgi:tetratricopeptide (TPR) repeat protein